MNAWKRLILMPAVWIIPWPFCGLLTLICLANLALGSSPRLFTALLPICAAGPLVWTVVVLCARARLAHSLRKSHWSRCPKCDYRLDTRHLTRPGAPDAEITCPECGHRNTVAGIQRYWKSMLGERRSKTGAGYED